LRLKIETPSAEARGVHTNGVFEAS
jgi:hypothetical protein